MEIAWRIEKVDANEVLFEIVGTPFSKQVNRNAARIRSDNRAGTATLIDLLEERALDVQILDDRFDDQIAIFDLVEVVVEVANAYERCRFGNKKCGGLCFFCCLQSASGNAVPYFLTL